MHAIVPAIQNWQLDEVPGNKAGSGCLGKLLKQALDFASASSERMSEVSTHQSFGSYERWPVYTVYFQYTCTCIMDRSTV